MKKWTLLLLIIVPLLSIGQDQKKIDSLLILLKNAKTDSTKNDLLINVWDHYVDTDGKNAIKFAQRLVDLGKSSKKESILAGGYMRLAISHGYISIDSSLKYNKLALHSYQNRRDTLRTAVIQMNLGVDYTDLGEYDKALKAIDEAFIGFSVMKDTLGMGQSLENRCRLHFVKGFYKLALIDATEAIRHVQKTNNQDYLERMNSRLAEIYNVLGDTIAANKIYNNIINQIDKDVNLRKLLQYRVSQAEMFILHNYNLNIAERILKESKPKIQELGDYLTLINVNNAFANIKIRKKEFQESLKYLDQNKHLFKDFGSDKLKSQTFNMLGSVQLELKNNVKAKEFALNALSLSEKIGILEEQVQAYGILTEIASQNRNYQEALEYQELKSSIYDSLYNIKKVNQIQELNIIHKTEKKEAEITLQKEEINTLNEKAKVDKLTKGLYAGGMFSAFALSGLLFFGFRQRVKKNRIAREKQEEIYKQEIEHKKKELASQTLHLVQKSKFISELKDNLEKVKNSPELFKIEFKRIVMLLKKQSAADKDWEVFKSYFSEVHQDFDEKLQSLNSKITDKELRLASYVKMGLNNTEIADILNVLPSSIHTSKYRLKQKLNIDKELDFDGFIKSL
ncbi:LuxR C-terminal-related transcriptional regulator [uncultured Maribacter sp.]|uniref:helix-turn-helix transcriptional regulator n=1 Tax=uncultured Maribacter sp. TaxID=431308 RepID=UPI0030DB1788|tara:strand:- start:11621 stop:13492 length:1872 start_codon:yes stop_codon:yes gene_type:complete